MREAIQLKSNLAMDQLVHVVITNVNVEKNLYIKHKVYKVCLSVSKKITSYTFCEH